MKAKSSVITRAQASIAKKVYVPKPVKNQVKVSSSGGRLKIKTK